MFFRLYFSQTCHGFNMLLSSFLSSHPYINWTCKLTRKCMKTIPSTRCQIHNTISESEFKNDMATCTSCISVCLFSSSGIAPTVLLNKKEGGGLVGPREHG
jgi:hypothetical protein